MKSATGEQAHAAVLHGGPADIGKALAQPEEALILKPRDGKTADARDRALCMALACGSAEPGRRAAPAASSSTTSPPRPSTSSTSTAGSCAQRVPPEAGPCRRSAVHAASPRRTAKGPRAPFSAGQPCFGFPALPGATTHILPSSHSSKGDWQ